MSDDESTLNKILNLKEQIWEAKAYISSESCRRCFDMYNNISRLEEEIKKLEKELETE